MKIIKRITFFGLIVTIFLLFFTSPALGYNLQKKFIPSNAKWLIHLDFKVLFKTKIWNSIYNEEKGKIHDGKEKLLKELNFDIFNDLNSVTIYGRAKANKDGVVILSGIFDRKKILQRLKSEKKTEKFKYKDSDIYNWDSDDYGAFVSKNLLVITHSRENLESALDVIRGRSSNFIGSDLSKRLKEIPHDSIIFALVGDLSSLIGKHHTTPIMINKTKMALFLVLEKNSDMRLSLKLHTESPEAAKNIMQIGNGLLALARLSKKELKGKEQLVNSIQISANGKMVKALMLIPSDFILKNIHKH